MNDRITELEQQLAEREKQIISMREDLEFIKHKAEGQRVWGGMDWSYRYPYKEIFERLENALDATQDFKELGK